MIAYDAYKAYLAIRMHFRSDSYDYFKYNGAIRSSPDTFKKRKDTRVFLKISEKLDPLAFIAGNIMFNPNEWVGAFTDEYMLMLIKYRDTGTYIFKQDIEKMLPKFNDNFVVDPHRSIPHIINLYNSGKVSLLTCSVFDQLLNCNNKWARSDYYPIFSTTSKKIAKSVGFFNIKPAKYKAIVMESSHFNGS